MGVEEGGGRGGEGGGGANRVGLVWVGLVSVEGFVKRVGRRKCWGR